jgi:hypothetical protein
MLSTTEYIETSEQMTHCRSVTLRKNRNRSVYHNVRYIMYSTVV